MATLPLTLLNGTIADANEVMSLFYPIYGPPVGGTGIDESNIDTPNKTGAGAFALQQYPAFTKGFSVNSPNLITNGRLVYSAGRLKLVGDDGNDPSTTNPVNFTVTSTTGGRIQQISFTSPTNCFIDDASSGDSYFYDAVNGGTGFGNILGLNGVFPFSIYIATDGTTPVVFMSRNPCMTTIPSDTNLIGYKNHPPLIDSLPLVNPDKQLEVTAWTATNILATHAGKPCVRIGSVRMAITLALGDWTIQALDTGDGLGNYYNFGSRLFTCVIPASGSYFVVTAGTPPTYTTTSEYYFRSDLQGNFHIYFNFQNSAGGTAGAGANDLQLSLPARPYTEDTQGRKHLGNFYLLNNANKTLGSMVVDFTYPGAAYFAYQSTIATAVSNIHGADQNNATRTLYGNVIYPVFA